MSKQLNEPITENGIRNTNFFNGRLLTARDLQTDQQAERSQRWQLGRAIGEGIVQGLEVSLVSPGDRTTAPVVSITKGLAINRKGQLLSLPNDDQVALTRTTELPPPEAGLFGECGLPTTTFSNLDKAIYLLVVGPASTFRERAPMRSVEANNALAGCGSKFAVEGVQFELIKLDFNTMTTVNETTRTQITGMLNLSDAASISKLRNILAHLCFETEEPTPQRRDPFKRLAGNVNSGAVSELRRLRQISDCEVPLTLLYWSGSSVQFIDNWAVRRLARRVPELDVLSILRSYGYERLLQFQTQLEDLFNRLGGLAPVEVQNYFQYLPAVGYFPVTGARSPRGFSPTNFFRQHAIGQTGDLTVERFGALLRESFTCPNVDLQTRSVFQTYRVRDNIRAVAASASPSQLYHVFVDRSLNGPLASDGVAKAFVDAWDAYRGLIKRRVFLPAPSDEAKIAAQHTITSSIRDVLDVANRQHALAGARALDADAALEAFREIYVLQNDLARLFQSNIPGIIDTQDREVFAQRLADLLNRTTPPGILALDPAITARDLRATVAAQNAINQFVGSWSGEGVALGPFGARDPVSPEGVNLVRGRTEPFPHSFTVFNSTDKRLTFGLEAQLVGPGGAWTGEATIESTSREEISRVDLASGDSATIVVKVKAPLTANVRDIATLTLSVIAGPPTSRISQATLSLTVAEESGPPVTSTVIFAGTATTPAGDPDNANENQPFTYGFNVRYSTSTGSTAVERFRFRIDLTTDPTPNDLTNGWRVRSQGQPLANPSPGVFTREVDLTPSVTSLVELTIFSPRVRTGTSQTAAFTVRIESVNLTTKLSQDYPESSRPETFRLRLRGSS